MCIFFCTFAVQTALCRKNSISEKDMETKQSKPKSPRTGLWLLIVAAVALETIACIQYLYSRSIIRDQAVYRAKAELRAAELEINVATAEMEAAAKMLAMMAEHNLDNPKAIYGCTQTLLVQQPRAGYLYAADRQCQPRLPASRVVQQRIADRQRMVVRAVHG